MIPPNLTAGTKLASYRASGLVHWPGTATQSSTVSGSCAIHNGPLRLDGCLALCSGHSIESLQCR